MAIFLALYSVAEAALLVVVVAQTIIIIKKGQPHTWLLAFGAQLSAYTYQIFLYLTYNSNLRPFPFSRWPNGFVPPFNLSESELNKTTMF